MHYHATGKAISQKKINQHERLPFGHFPADHIGKKISATLFPFAPFQEIEPVHFLISGNKTLLLSHTKALLQES